MKAPRRFKLPNDPPPSCASDKTRVTRQSEILTEDSRLQIIAGLRQMLASNKLPDKYLKAFRRDLEFFESLRGTK